MASQNDDPFSAVATPPSSVQDDPFAGIATPAAPAAPPPLVANPITAIGKTLGQAWNTIDKGATEAETMPAGLADLHALGTAAKTIGTAPFNLIGNEFPQLGGAVKKALTPAPGSLGEMALNAGSGAWDNLKENHPKIATALNDVFNIVGVLPVGKLLGGVEGAAVGGAAKLAARPFAPILTDAGIKAHLADLKISNSLGKQAARNAVDGKFKIVGGAVRGNYTGKLTPNADGTIPAVENAQTFIDDAQPAATQLKANYDITHNNAPVANINDVFENIEKNIRNNNYKLGSKNLEDKAVYQLHDLKQSAAVQTALGGTFDPTSGMYVRANDMANLSQIDNIKKGIDFGSKGAPQSADEALGQRLRNEVYFQLKKIEDDKIPELKPINDEIHNAILYKQAALESASKKVNYNMFGTLGDWGVMSAGTAAVLHNPATLPLALLALGGGKLASWAGRSGAVSSGMIKLGRKLGGKEPWQAPEVLPAQPQLGTR